MEADLDRWVDEFETARISGKKVRTLRNDRFLGKGFPYYKVGRSVRYKLADILREMERHRVNLNKS